MDFGGDELSVVDGVIEGLRWPGRLTSTADVQQLTELCPADIQYIKIKQRVRFGYVRLTTTVSLQLSSGLECLVHKSQARRLAYR